jgi:hypothetical protein
VGNSKIKGRRLLPGKTQRRAFEMHAGGVTGIQTSTGSALEDVQRAFRRGEGLGVRDLLQASQETFYGDRRELFYESAWLLVHYLRDGAPEWVDGRFPQLVLYVSEGYPGEVAFRKVYGDPADHEVNFGEYVKKFH